MDSFHPVISHRKRLGLTQVRLAAYSGISPNIIWKLERGSLRILLSTLQRIAETLRIPLGQLVQEMCDYREAREAESVDQVDPNIKET